MAYKRKSGEFLGRLESRRDWALGGVELRWRCDVLKGVISTFGSDTKTESVMPVGSVMLVKWRLAAGKWIHSKLTRVSMPEYMEIGEEEIK